MNNKFTFSTLLFLAIMSSFSFEDTTPDKSFFDTIIEKFELVLRHSQNESSNSVHTNKRVALLNDFLVVNKSVDSTSVQTGRQFVYSIQYSCASTTLDCENVMIKDTLPPGLEFVSFLESPIHSNATTYDAGSNSVNFSLNKQTGTGVSAGSTGEVKILVRFPNGTTPDGTIADNYAVITADNANTVVSNTVSTTATAASGWEVDKKSTGTIRLDTDFTYDISVNDALNGSFGSLDLDTFTLIDMLPTDVTFVSATNGGIYDAGTNTVTWGFGDTNHNTTENVSVTVNFPTGTFAENDVITNEVDFFAQPVGEPYAFAGTDQVSHTIQPPVPDAPSASVDKDLEGDNSFILGDTLNWTFDLENTGNTALDLFTLTDTLPTQVEVVQLTTGQYNNAPLALNIYYQTNLNATPTLYPGSPFNGVTEQTLTVATDLALAANEFISVLSYEFGTVPEGFQSTNDINFYTEVLSTDHAGNPVNTDDVIENKAFLSYEFNVVPDIATDTESGTVRDVLPPATEIDKQSNSNDVPIGGELNWVIIPANAGDFDLDSIVMIDTLPAELEFNFTESGGWINLTTDVEVYYQTNLNTNYQAWAGSPYAPTSDSQLYGSDLGLATSEYVTIIKWIFREPKRGFTHDGNRPRIRGKLLEVDRNGNPVSAGLTTENCISMTGYLNGVAYPSSDCAQTTILNPIVEGDPDKFVVESGSLIRVGGPYFPGDTIEYQVTVQNNSSSTDSLVNPILVDLLPTDLAYIEGSQMIINNNFNYPVPIFEKIENYNSTGRTLLRWSWVGASAADFLVNTEVEIRYQTILGPGVEVGETIPNTAYQTTNDTPFYGCDESSDIDEFDLDGDGLITDLLCKDDFDAEISIFSVPSLTSEKLVKGELDTAFSKFPNTGLTVPGGNVLYNLTVTNDGTIPMTNVNLIDILPFVGDRGVIDLSQRESRWRPNLVGSIAAPAGATVYYSTAQNPCRSAEGIVPSGPAGCTDPMWTTVLPDDLASVQSFKVDFGDIIIRPGDELMLEWDMKAPVNALPDIGVQPDSIAWNSFGYIANRVNPDGSVGAALLPAEPVKVGIEIMPPIRASYGDFVWEDSNQDGDQDAGELGVDGVRVEFYLDNGDGLADPAVDSLISFTLTADGGLYLFPELDPADYFAVFYTPQNHLSTTANTGDDALDSDAVSSTFNGYDVAITEVTTISDNEQDVSWDYGVYPDNTATLGNYVWYDENQDGIQNEANSFGVNNILVKLYNGTGTLLDSIETMTDINGNPGWYQFDSLAVGDYYLEFDIPASFSFTTATNGGGAIDQTDSDAVVTADATVAQTEILTLAAGQIDYSWDAGLILPTGVMSLGNFVWDDVNNDGDYDPATEMGINGVVVNVYEDSDGNGVFTPGVDAFLSTATTQISGGVPGHYLFSDLPEGDYIVQLAESNFVNGGILKNYSSSTGNGVAPDPDNDLNFDDNGEPLDGYGIVSQAVTLSLNSEPANDEDTDLNSNLTVDFGVFLGIPCGVIISDFVLGECSEASGSAQIEISYTVNWYNVPDPTQNILITVGGLSQSPITTAAAGTNGSISFNSTVAADGSTADLIAHFASDVNCADTVSYTVTNGCDFQIIKTADKTEAIVGDSITYTYMVVNNSTEPITLDSIFDDKIGKIETSVAGLSRVSDQQQVYYRFEDMTGTTISDISGVGTPLNLEIEEAGFAWGSDSLTITSANRATNYTDNNKIYNAAILSNQLTVEAWIRPVNNTQGGAARIITLSDNNSNRNFQLMQDGNDYDFRLYADNNTQTLSMNNVIDATPALQHVVYTYDGITARFYINSVENASAVYNDALTWDATYDFGLANEFDSNPITQRDWLGDFHLVSVYTKALSPTEILENYNAGLLPEIEKTVIAPNDTATFTAKYEVLESDKPGPLTNIATVSGQRDNTPISTTTSLEIAFRQTCGDITELISPRSICSGENVDTLAALTTFANPDSIAFVYFNTAQTDSSLIYTGGIGIDTVQITAASDTARITDVSGFTNTGSGTEQYFVYAIAHPTPLDVTCRPYEEILVTVNPLPTASATATNVSCTPPSTTPNNDGSINLMGFAATDTYQYSIGNTFDIGNAIPASPTTIPNDGVLVNNLTNPSGSQSYTVRITNASACFVDRTVILNEVTCAASIDYPDYSSNINPCPDEACHTISPDLYLGQSVSPDASPNTGENADSDDDDGIAINSKMQFVAGNMVRFPVTIYNNTGNPAYLRIWIDWNGDGDFEDVGEQVEDNTYPSTGTENLIFVSVTIPSDVVQTSSIALRARLSTDNFNSSTPCGTGTCAADGEIEDYLIEVVCPMPICPPVQLIKKSGNP